MKLKETKMFKKTKEPKIKYGKKHTNKITVELVYNKDSVVPAEINVHKNCTVLDLFATVVHLSEIMSAEAKAGDTTMTSFLIACAQAYINKFDKD